MFNGVRLYISVTIDLVVFACTFRRTKQANDCRSQSLHRDLLSYRSMERAENSRPCVVVDKRFAQQIRQLLESKGFWDCNFGVTKLHNGEVAIPICTDAQDMVQQDKAGELGNITYRLSKEIVPHSRKKMVITPREHLTKCLKKLLDGAGLKWSQDLEDDVPKRWEKHGDLVLLPDVSFQHPTWKYIDPTSLWKVVSTSLHASRVAKKGVIEDNDFRSPKVELLLGNDGWVEQTDNGIRFTYDISHCMYSSGNITEKLRVAGFDCRGETVVDLYAGIGYFTLPYLVHAKASMVHACEWNPHALGALAQNLKLNNVEDRCRLHAGDNAKVCPKGVADRVNLGLIPSSEQGWPVACAALKHTGGILHIHGNVTTTPQHKMDYSRLKMEDCYTTKVTDIERRTCDSSDDIERAGISRYDSSASCGIVAKSNSEDLGNSQIAESVQLQNITDQKSKGQYADSSKSIEHRTDHTNQPNNFDSETVQSTHNALVSKSRTSWCEWADNVTCQIKSILEELHDGKDWTVSVLHVEHVKSYAPHVDHIVADIECRPR